MSFVFMWVPRLHRGPVPVWPGIQVQLHPGRPGQPRLQGVQDLQQEALQDLQSEITSCLLILRR